MLNFFFRARHSSRAEAKQRLNAVIEGDRINVSQGKTLEKIRKEVAAVLKKYSSDDAAVGNISVTGASGGECVLAARIPLKTTT